MKELFNSFKHRAYRIETLPNYQVGSEIKSYNNFINGLPLDYGDNEWINNLIQWKKEGKKVKRIRIISEELTTYEKYEFYCYHNNFIAGEEIKIIPRHIYKNLVSKEYQFDYWIFDDTYICKLNYDSQGNYINNTILSKNINKYIEIYKLLDSNAKLNYYEIVKQINNYNVKINFNCGSVN